MNEPKLITLPCRSYPIRTTDLASYSYKNYRLQNVYESLTPEQQRAVIEFWLDNGALTSREAAQQRSSEVCYLISEQNSGKIVGVTTLYPDRVGDPPDLCLLMRMFITPSDRRTWLAICAAAMTLVFASKHLSDRGYAGVVNVNENLKLARSGTSKRFEAAGYCLLGQWRGQDVWFFDFKQTQFIDSITVLPN